MSQLVYVLPVHNEERILAASVARLKSVLANFHGAEVYLIENGSTDASWEIAEQLAAESLEGEPKPNRVTVRAYREPSAGIGWAYHRGLTEALAAFGPRTTRWVVLTATDLPFGFSDLEAAFVALERSPSRILMGSKAHPESRADTGPLRRSMSFGYRVARRAMLGMEVGDSQGSMFVRLDLGSELLPRMTSRNSFYSTELCHHAERAGENIVELPVVLEPSRRASTIKPFKHGFEMARQLWEQRQRDRKPH